MGLLSEGRLPLTGIYIDAVSGATQGIAVNNGAREVSSDASPGWRGSVFKGLFWRDGHKHFDIPVAIHHPVVMVDFEAWFLRELVRFIL